VVRTESRHSGAGGSASLFAGWLLEPPAGPEHVFGVLAVLVSGCAAIVSGVVRSERRSEPDLDAMVGD